MYSKKEYQRRCLQEQEANGRVFQDFLETFQADTKVVKTKSWIKAGSFDAGTGREDETEKGIIYEPKPLMKGQQDQQSTIRNAIECARIIKDKKNERKKHTTNLEALKEEIKQRHMERQKVKTESNQTSAPNSDLQNGQQIAQQDMDPNSTNLYLGNINPKLTEFDLIQMFGAYGPLASVKIMWPRGEDSANRNSHCGFVAYMSRKDAERAYDAMKSTDIKISWGKFVEVPQFPIYIPPALQALTQPPPFSGLPFNAQPLDRSVSGSSLCNTVVKVSIPNDKKLLVIIHRMIEFVIREGPLFEAMIMKRELKNPLYKFLFENASASHTYYRWKLYSLMNGEAVKSWSTKPFRMFTGGSLWVPPTSLDFSQGMPEQLLEKSKQASLPRLSETQGKRFFHFLRELSLKRLKIGETMVFCLNHADCSSEIVEYIYQSLCDPTTNPLKKLARLFLVSDILCNCTCTGKNYAFRTDFEKVLPEIFEQMHQTLENMKYSCDREAFKTRVSKILREWELWKIYSDEFLNNLETIFLSNDDTSSDSSETLSLEDERNQRNRKVDLNIPFPPIKKCKKEESKPSQNVEQISGFVPSKWETVDPEEVEAQAMSTKKFYRMQMQMKHAKEEDEEFDDKENGRNLQERKSQKCDLIDKKSASSSSFQSNSSSPTFKKRQDKKRKRLRELEVMVMEFQDDLETGHRKLRKEFTVEKEVERYRAKLMRELEDSNEDSSSCDEGKFKREEDGRSEKRKNKNSHKKPSKRCEKRSSRHKY